MLLGFSLGFPDFSASTHTRSRQARLSDKSETRASDYTAACKSQQTSNTSIPRSFGSRDESPMDKLLQINR